MKPVWQLDDRMPITLMNIKLHNWWQQTPHHVDGDLANWGLAMLLTEGLDFLHCWHLLEEHILQGATASGVALRAAGTYCWQWVDSLWEMPKLYITHKKYDKKNSNRKDLNKFSNEKTMAPSMCPHCIWGSQDDIQQPLHSPVVRGSTTDPVWWIYTNLNAQKFFKCTTIFLTLISVGKPKHFFLGGQQ